MPRAGEVKFAWGPSGTSLGCLGRIWVLKSQHPDPKVKKDKDPLSLPNHGRRRLAWVGGGQWMAWESSSRDTGWVRRDKSIIEACATQMGRHPHPTSSPAHEGCELERIKWLPLAGTKRDASVWRPYHLKSAEKAVLLRRRTFLLVVEKLRIGPWGQRRIFPVWFTKRWYRRWAAWKNKVARPRFQSCLHCLLAEQTIAMSSSFFPCKNPK